MNKPWRITFTGIEESCGHNELFDLLFADPRIELGVLFSETRAGAGRYPSHAWIANTGRIVNEGYPHGRLALHVCGRAVEKLIRNHQLAPLKDLYRHFSRIQLNGPIDDETRVSLRRWLDRRWLGDGGLRALITQYDSNPDLHGLLGKPYHQVLFDASGGTGVVRDDWPKPLSDWRCGYAGGLGPDNLRTELLRIAAAAGPYPYWIDMESSLRDENDLFSFDKARSALKAIHEAERVLSPSPLDHGSL